MFDHPYNEAVRLATAGPPYLVIRLGWSDGTDKDIDAHTFNWNDLLQKMRERVKVAS